MLFQEFNLQIARFPSLNLIDLEEIKQADMVEIDEYVEQGIYHSSQLNWKGDLTFIKNPIDFLRSEKERKTVDSSRQYFIDQGYELKIEQVDEAINKNFFKLYQETTQQKNRAIEFDTMLIVEKNLKTNIPVFLFGLYRDQQLESGLLVSLVRDELRVMFGAKKKFPNVRGGIGGILEMMLLEFALEKRYLKISHGLSTNPAGILDTAGIFEFKTRYGFTAFPVGEWKTMFILTPTVTQSDLVFVTISDDKLSHLIVSDEVSSVVSKYCSRYITHASQISLSDFITKSRNFLLK